MHQRQCRGESEEPAGECTKRRSDGAESAGTNTRRVPSLAINASPAESSAKRRVSLSAQKNRVSSESGVSQPTAVLTISVIRSESPRSTNGPP